MTSLLAGSRRPLLAVPHGLRSVPALQVAEAASGLCDLLWLVDESIPEVALIGRRLKKLGTVVNLAGLSPDEAASLLRSHAPRGVVAYRDEDILPMSFIAAELGLDYHTPDLAQHLVDKFLQREALGRGGLPSPRCWEVPAERSRAAIDDLAAAVQFPAVLKPRTGSGGQDTVLIADAGDLVRQISSLPSRAGGGSGMFVEEYLPSHEKRRSERFADYMSVESLVESGEISHLAVTGRFPPAEPFRETGFFIPAELDHTELPAVLAVATEALRILNVRTGGCHTEIKLTPDGPRVIEVNGRLGGGVPEMLLQASGARLYELSIRVALGEPLDLEWPVRCTKVGWRFLMQPPAFARRVVSIDGLDRLAKHPGVNTIFLNRAPGDLVDWREGTRNYIYSVYGVSADYDELLEVNRYLHEEVSIAYA
ncbi:MAG TPA: ATP-grasp domain-containing protein [Acidimicrobiales bacterium]|nr:ATP-grasp domain-containing protein [Acidimicrobiales bacterium]